MKFLLDKNSPVPLYTQIRQALENHIRTEGITPGEALPTLMEISQAASVSIRTVQKALQELLEEGICHRSGSRRLILGRSPVGTTATEKRNVIIVCHRLGETCVYTDFISMRLMAGLQTEAANLPDMEIVLAGIPLAGSLKFYLENPCMNILGVVLIHWIDREEMTNLAREFPDVKFMHLNYVISDMESLPENIYGVYNDDYAGGYQGAEFLLTHKVRHPAFFELILPEDNDTYLLRRRGFLAAVNNHGKTGLSFQLPPNERGRTFSEQIRNHKEFFGRTLTAHPDIDGILTCYDPLAEAIGEYMLQRGLAEKIKLISYDGYMEMNTCIFSAVEVNYYAMGQKAARFLAEPDGKPRFLRILPQLVIRNSGFVQPRGHLAVSTDSDLTSAARVG